MKKSFLQKILSRFAGSVRAENVPEPTLTELVPGKKMTITITSMSVPESELLLSTKFEGLDDNGHLIVAAPLYKGSEFRIPPGKMCVVTYNSDSYTLCIDCRTKRIFSEGGLRFLLLERVSDIQKIERRDDYRLPVSLPCSVCRYEVAADGENTQTIYEGKVLDISGGGARILISAMLNHGEQIICAVAFGEHGQKHIVSTVRWIAPLSYNHADIFVMGLRFNFLSGAEKDVIVQYVFREQLKRARPGYRKLSGCGKGNDDPCKTASRGASSPGQAYFLNTLTTFL